MRKRTLVIAALLAISMFGCNEMKLKGNKEAINTTKRGAAAQKNQPQPRQKGPDIYKVPVGNSPQKGPKDALVTIVEFSDFQCPFCRRVTQTLKQIEETYGNKVRLVYKFRPLPFHKNAMPAALAAYAAMKQGKFWEYHDKLFANQQQLTRENFLKWAKELGMDVKRFEKDMDSQAAKDFVNRDNQLAMKVGANGTPTFFINGKKLIGAQPFDNFKRMIDQEIKKAQDLLKKGVKRVEIYNKVLELNAKNTNTQKVAPRVGPNIKNLRIQPKVLKALKGKAIKGGK